MKHYMDIEALRCQDEVGFKKSNCGFFVKGDHIQITEKYDGSNASVQWVDGELCAFSRKRKLTAEKGLNGFYDFVQSFSDVQKKFFEEHPGLVMFGEWSNKNKIMYADTGKVKHWYVFDAFDVSAGKYLRQKAVKKACDIIGLEYINVLYDGPFTSWDDCKQYMNKNTYGDVQEGIVVKNQDRTGDDRNPGYLKMVNDSFKERNSVKLRQVDPQKQADMKKAEDIAQGIVTPARVEKVICKLQSQGDLPQELCVKDLGAIAKIVPKAVYEDCCKEESEYVEAAGKYFSKACHSLTMIATRSLIS